MFHSAKRPQQKYRGAIWTNHAIERLQQRKLPQDMAWQAFQYPDKTIPSNQNGALEYHKRYGNSLVTVIAKQNERKEWIILSCWVEPPQPGSIDLKKREAYVKYRHAYQKAGFLGRFWLEIKRQVFSIRY